MSINLYVLCFTVEELLKNLIQRTLYIFSKSICLKKKLFTRIFKLNDLKV